jgi:hypothetical protein
MGVVEVITWLLREEHQLPWVIYICSTGTSRESNLYLHLSIRYAKLDCN